MVNNLVSERECRQWAATSVDRVVKIYQERCLPHKPEVEVMTVEEKTRVCNELLKFARSDSGNITSFLDNLVEEAATRCGNPPLQPPCCLRGVLSSQFPNGYYFIDGNVAVPLTKENLAARKSKK